MIKNLEQRSFILLLLIVTGLFFWLIGPFFTPLFWACAVALLFYPVNRRLRRRWKGRNRSAAATLLLCIVSVVLPVLLILAAFVDQATQLYEQIGSGDLKPAQLLEQVRAALPAPVENLLERFHIDQQEILERAGAAAVSASQFIAENALSLGQSTFAFFLGLGVMLYVTYFLLRDGDRLVNVLIDVLPLGDERERLIFSKFAEVTRATLKGNGVVALVQGALGGLIFWWLGLPAPVLWGVAMAALSLVPAVGAPVIWIPAAIWLYATDEWVRASILIAWGVFIIGLADNLLRPVLVGKDTKLPDWLVLVSTLGGLAMFGVSGFIIGPLIAALFVVFWQMFGREFNDQSTGADFWSESHQDPDRPLED